MQETVIGYFDSPQQADNAIGELKQALNDQSPVIMRRDLGKSLEARYSAQTNAAANQQDNQVNQQNNAINGLLNLTNQFVNASTAAGSLIGGLTAFTFTAGASVLPYMLTTPLMIMNNFTGNLNQAMGQLTSSATGGAITGGQGNSQGQDDEHQVLVSIQSDGNGADIAGILRRYGARDVRLNPLQ